jgi:hypothetical protein
MHEANNNSKKICHNIPLMIIATVEKESKTEFRPDEILSALQYETT